MSWVPAFSMQIVCYTRSKWWFYFACTHQNHSTFQYFTNGNQTNELNTFRFYSCFCWCCCCCCCFILKGNQKMLQTNLIALPLVTRCIHAYTHTTPIDGSYFLFCWPMYNVLLIMDFMKAFYYSKFNQCDSTCTCTCFTHQVSRIFRIQTISSSFPRKKSNNTHIYIYISISF